jgi:hypothetical protein
VQRSLAGVLFLIAAVALSVAAGAWWLQRTAFTPGTSQNTAEAILNDDQIRGEIATVVSAATAATLEQSPNELATELVDPLMGSRAGAAVMTDIVADAHRRVIGSRDEPVRITGVQMVDIVRDERVAELPPVTLPVPEVGALAVLSNTLGWIAAVTGVLGLVLLLLGVAVRPERGEVVRGLGEFGFALALSALLFGWLIPVIIVPAIDDSTWTQAIPRLATRSLPLVLGVAVIGIAAGIVLSIRAAGMGRRRQWSTPLAVSRYRDDRSW